MIRRLAQIAFAIGLLPISAFGQSTGQATGTVQGMVFTADADGGRSVVPAVKISLDGSSHIELKAPPKVSSYSARFLPVRTRSPRKLREWVQRSTLRLQPRLSRKSSYR